jgi:hypothetical protein
VSKQPASRFAGQLRTGVVAGVLGIDANRLQQWLRRYGSRKTGPYRDPHQRLLSVPEVLALRAAVLLVDRHSFPVGDAVTFCLVNLPRSFEQLLTGERRDMVAHVENADTGKTIALKLDLIAADLLPKLGLGITVPGTALTPLSEAQIAAEIARAERHMATPEFRQRLAEFRSHVKARGTPTTPEETAAALGLPVWLVRMTLRETATEADAPTLAEQLRRLDVNREAIKS